MVGRLSRIRVSSVIAIFPSRSSVGTLKSTRTRTRRPRTSRSRRESFVIPLMDEGRFQSCFSPTFLRLFPEQLQHLDATIAVTPLVVVPTDDFHEFSAVRHRQFAVENAGVRVADDIDRDQRLVAIFENAFVTLAFGG